MRRSILSCLLAVTVIACVGCTAGPSPFRRKVDDYWNRKYEERPIETSVLSNVVPYYPFLNFGAFFLDWAIVNPTQFWTHDLWNGKGAAYVHEQPDGQNDGIWPWLRGGDAGLE